jgi:hypothetical protein
LGLFGWPVAGAAAVLSGAPAGGAAVEDALLSELLLALEFDCWQESEIDFTLVTL